MTFASELEKPASERFFLAQITARKYLGLGTSIGGGQYTFDIGSGYIITTVYVNGVSATFSYAGDVVTVTSASDLTSGSFFTIMDHELYMTGTKQRVTASVSGLPDAQWLPIIQEYPGFSQSMRDITEGVFSLSSSELKIFSTDLLHQRICGINDSLAKAPVKIWACVNDLSLNRLVFSGEVTNAKYQYGILTIGLVDAFRRLADPALFGTSEQAYSYRGNADRPFVEVADEGSPVPITFGYSSPILTKPSWRHLDPFGDPIGPTWHVADGTKAVKFSPDIPDSTSVVTYSAGRISSSDILRLNFGTISAAYEHWVSRKIPVDSNVRTASYYDIDIYDRIVYLFCSSVNAQIGDYIPQLNGWVCQVGNYGFGSYNLAVACPFYGVSDVSGIGSPPPTSGSISVPSIPNNTIPSMCVWIESGDAVLNQHINIPLALNPDLRTTVHSTRYVPFSVSLTPYTHAGDTINQVTFTIDPVAASLIDTTSAGASVNPLLNKTVKYCYRLTNQKSHAEGLKYFLTSAGMSTNAASFTQANSDLAAILSMTVPLNKTEYEPMLEVCQAVTTSTLGMLRVNDAREIEYLILDTPVTADFDRDTSDILQDGTASTIEYQDIYTSVNYENPQLKSVQNVAGVYTQAIVGSDKNAFLHRTARTKQFKHYLKDITSIVTRLLNYLKEPTVGYNISTSSKDLDTAIGDIVDVTNKAVMDQSGNTKAMVVGVDASSSRTNVKLNELRGI